MMVFWGSDTDQLRTSASQIDGVGDTIEAMLSGLGSEAQALDWQGEDAVAFVDSVSRTRRDGGATFVASLRSLTAAMRANAEAQDAVSASVSTAGGSGFVLQGPGAFVPEDGFELRVGGGPGLAVTDTEGISESVAGAGAPAGRLEGSDRSWQQVEDAYRRDFRKYGLGSIDPDGEYGWQCVSWAKFRAAELGFNPGGAWGNGGAVAGNLGGSSSAIPELGAIISYGGDGGGFGHVMVAEEVFTTDGGQVAVRVSEMNVGGNGALVANPDEYRATRVFTRTADGSWSDGSGVRTLTVFNPDYPN